MPQEQALEKLRGEYDLDEFAADNVYRYLNEQREATRAVPSDRTIVIERFRDEIGDWRLCVLTPFGGRVHAAWAMAVSARLRAERDLDADAIWSDDGVILHLPDADDPPPSDLALLDPEELEDLVTAELGNTALFGSRFREAAARSLLIPRRMPNQRTPLWQQRLKAQGLLQVARRFGEFPVVLETYRECLQDWLDLPALKTLLERLERRDVALVEVETPTASPFAQSLLFDYIATYMYEGDTPRAEQRAAALALDRDLLRELLGAEELRELIDPDALASVEEDLQRLNPARAAGDADQLHDMLRTLGDLSDDELQARVVPGIDAQHLAARLVSERRAVKVRLASEQRWIDAGDAGLYRDALGVVPPARPARAVPGRRRRAAAEAAAPVCAHPWAVHDGGGLRPVRARAGAHGRGADRARARRRGRAGRDPPEHRRARGKRARVVRSRRAAPPAPREPRGPAQGDRADRPGNAGALRRVVARHRPLRAERSEGRGRAHAARRRPGPASGGARTFAGTRSDPGDLGARRSAAPPRPLRPRVARPAVRRGRGGVGRSRQRLRPGRACGAVLPRGRTLHRAATRPGRRRAARPRPRRTARAARGGRGVLVGSADRPRRVAGGPARCAVGLGVGRRGHERRVRAAARAAPVARPAGAPERSPAPVRLAAHRLPAPAAGPLEPEPATCSSRARPRRSAPRRAPSCCSSATAWWRARR